MTDQQIKVVVLPDGDRQHLPMPIPTNPNDGKPYFVIPDKFWGGTWIARIVSGDYGNQNLDDKFGLIDE